MKKLGYLFVFGTRLVVASTWLVVVFTWLTVVSALWAVEPEVFPFQANITGAFIPDEPVQVALPAELILPYEPEQLSNLPALRISKLGKNPVYDPRTPVNKEEQGTKIQRFLVTGLIFLLVAVMALWCYTLIKKR
ncbi:MAG: hypothetical protein AB1611_18720 [bacterium]